MCDRIVADISDQNLVIKLILNDKLTLDKCILQVRQEEEVRMQQEVMLGSRLFLIPSKISQDTNISLRHINNLRHK